MKALTVLYGGDLHSQALEPVFSGKNSLSLALEGARRFPGTEKLILLAKEDFSFTGTPPVSGLELIKAPAWTKRSLLETLSACSAGFDLSYFAWADCPFLDPVLAGALADRHLRYAAEYSYADGWPGGFAPEILSPGTAGILAKILGDDGGPVERDALFSVIEKDINSFDIETEISPADLRQHRLTLAADSKRNLLLLKGFIRAAGKIGGGEILPAADQAERIIAEIPEILRTLPNFYAVQVSGPCPHSCALCPYPRFGGRGDIRERKDFLDPEIFGALLDKICAFSGDAVIDLSLWGELGLHPRKNRLIRMVLDRPELALVIETSGLGWRSGEAETLAEAAAGAAALPERINPLPPLSWIVSLDAFDPRRYGELRGPGFPEAAEFAKRLLGLFPGDAYVQALRTAGDEDEVEKFYRFWKEAAPGGNANIIIQKYDDFCGYLPKKQASDISPVQRRPCWHLIRDMNILIDGTVPLCREELSAFEGKGRILGNAFSESLETIWSRGGEYYRFQCPEPGKKPEYAGLCAGCDEYYTYNF
jgi:spiro-SPASM protein